MAGQHLICDPYSGVLYGDVALPSNERINEHVAVTAARTLTALDSGRLFSNRGAAGSVTFTIPTPASATLKGCRYTFQKVANQDVVVTSALAAGIRDLAGTGVTLTNSTAGNYGSLSLECDGTEWLVVGKLGTWALT